MNKWFTKVDTSSVMEDSVRMLVERAVIATNGEINGEKAPIKVVQVPIKEMTSYADSEKVCIFIPPLTKTVSNLTKEDLQILNTLRIRHFVVLPPVSLRSLMEVLNKAYIKVLARE